MTGRAAVDVLRELTGRPSQYTPATKDKVKKDWRDWLDFHR